LEAGDLLALPPVGCDPDHPFDAVQELALVELQVSWVCPPAVMVEGAAKRETVGAVGGGAFTVICAVPQTLV
jgi:hypothetical protein